MDQLLEAQHMIVTEQQEVSYKAAHSTPSLNRLQQRLIVMERVFIALANRYSILQCMYMYAVLLEMCSIAFSHVTQIYVIICHDMS